MLLKVFKKYFSRNKVLTTFVIILLISFGAPKLLETFKGVSEIDNKVYTKIAIAIENVVILKGTFISFKTETSFKNFNVSLFYDLYKKRKDKGSKLDKNEIKTLFVKVGKDKVEESIQVIETLEETADQCKSLMDELLTELKRKDKEYSTAVQVWDSQMAALQDEWNAGLIVSPGKIEWGGAEKDCTYINSYCEVTDAWRRKCMCKGWIASAPKDDNWEFNPPGNQYKACNTGGGGFGGGIYGERYHWTRKDFARCPHGHSDSNLPGYNSSVSGCYWGLNDINCKQAYPELYTPNKDNNLLANHNKTGYGSVYDLAVARYGPRPIKEAIDIEAFICQDCRKYQDKINVTDSTEVNIEQIGDCNINLGREEREGELLDKQKILDKELSQPRRGENNNNTTQNSDNTTQNNKNTNMMLGLGIGGSVSCVIIVIVMIIIVSR